LQPVTAQWVQLKGGETLVASHTGAWIQEPQAAALELWGSMPQSQKGTLATTRHLLEGAMSAGERRATSRSECGGTSTGGWPPTPRRWALDLIDQWYTAHHSVALLPIAVERYDSMRRPELVRFARRKLKEETGHDRLPLNDLRALGYEPAVVQQVGPGATARRLVRYARECVRGPHPVGLLGYIFVLERRVLRITVEALRLLDGVLPDGIEAASGVRAHVLQFDAEHVEELVAFVATLPSDDRTAVALASYETAAIFAEAAAAEPDRNDLERERRLTCLPKPTLGAKEPRSDS
jgi:hypothetical protein